MAFGLPPKFSTEITFGEISNQRVLKAIQETFTRLDWKLQTLTSLFANGATGFSMSSWGETINIEIKETYLIITSKCSSSQFLDYGKNKKNVNQFRDTFLEVLEFTEEVPEPSTSMEGEEESSVQEEVLTQEETDWREGSPEKDRGIMDFLIPNKEIFGTPSLIIANVLIFILMVVSGVHVMEPDTQNLLDWGANFRPVTTQGEVWRILTSCFLHIGLFHLAMNMYALLYIGALLEPILGSARFLLAYILAGIAGSVASIWWNELTVSAGASGAIFGMYGVFMALLLSNIIPKAERKSLLASIGIFVGYNLLNGMQGGIDNAAHIGGLISGFIIGIILVPALKKKENEDLQRGTMIGSSFLILALSIGMYMTIKPGDLVEYDKEIQKFVRLEQEALSVYNLSPDASDETYLNIINSVGIPKWKECLQIVDKIDQMDLPEVLKRKNDILRKYVLIRIEVYELMIKIIETGDLSYRDQMEQKNLELEQLLKDLETAQ